MADGLLENYRSGTSPYLAILLAVLLIEILIILIVSLLIALSFILVGIWPAFICIFGITGIVIIIARVSFAVLKLS